LDNQQPSPQRVKHKESEAKLWEVGHRGEAKPRSS